ncbi:MAG: TIM44-like domain-containing protein [Candidatus Tectomicrobia bacterium]|uniref:TIM44-like domain-containing protein n=1 Tax=Tectimicrobiota bacterium TaxID=2528274 RepID=A0A932GNK0_UNCTE|nr:TIM44-like domain-containing protein [Candidatus Tectomicrobia bacterium]
MKHGRGWRVGAVMAMVLFLFLGVLELDAWARAGGGRSFGGGSSRSYSAPYRSNRSPVQRDQYRSSQTPRQPATPSAPASQPAGGGGFLRGLAGGIAGGFLGSLLFSSLGFGAGFGGLGGGGGGIGLLEILLFGAIAFGVVSYFRRRRQEGLAGAHGGHYTMGSGGYAGGCGSSYADRTDTAVEEPPELADLQRGLDKVSMVVPDFNVERFPEEAMDIFFRIQGAWANRNLDLVSDLLAPEVRQELQRGIDELKSQGKINRLENIAVRRSEIEEAWVEAGTAFVTIRFLANLLDYTVEEQSGRLVSGSKENPVKFEEYWTFVRPSGGADWQLTAIQQPQ